MRLGLSASSTSGLAPRDAARHLLARVDAARAAGLDTLTFGDSHNRSGPLYFQNVPTLARALAAWDPARPAGCLFLVPMWNPVLMAEQIGTLAAFHDGPFIVQTGLGGGADALADFGVSVEHRGRALDESLRIVRALFDGETVSSDMYGITAASFDLVPPEGVHWWMGTMNSAGLRRAARFGAAWYAAHAPLEVLPALLDEYRVACVDASAEPYVAARREAVVMADGDRARALAAAALESGYRGMSSEMVVAGAPDDVAEQLSALADLGIDEVMMRTMAIDPAIDLETITLLGEVRRTIGG